MSNIKTLYPLEASSAEKFTEHKVFPAPPFPLEKDIILPLLLSCIQF